jgi:hypothetical protein
MLTTGGSSVEFNTTPSLASRRIGKYRRPLQPHLTGEPARPLEGLGSGRCGPSGDTTDRATARRRQRHRTSRGYGRLQPPSTPVAAPRITRDMPVGSKCRSHRSSQDSTRPSRRIDLDSHPQRGNRRGNRAPREVFRFPATNSSSDCRRSGARFAGSAWARQGSARSARRYRALDPPGALPSGWQLPERHGWRRLRGQNTRSSV